MGQVNCLYCGEAIPDDTARCPACGAPSHFQRQGFRIGAKRRFVLLFALLTLTLLALAFWLPR